MSSTRLLGSVPPVVVALILWAACGCSAYDSHLLAANTPSAPGAAGAMLGAGRGVAGDDGNPGISVDPLSRGDGGADDASAGGSAGAAEGGAGSGAHAGAGSPSVEGGAGGTRAGGAGEVSAGAGGAGSAGSHAAGSGGTSAGAGGASTGGASGAGSGAATAGAGGAAGASCPEPGAVVWSQNGHCYFPTQNAASWNVSRDTCSQASAKLASITSATEQSFVGSLVTSTSRWIGLSRFGAPDFSWSSGEPLVYTNWASGEPSTVGEAGAALRSGTLAWFSASPSAVYPAICERPL